jgi:hypothetical protein
MKVLALASYLSAQVVSASKVPLGLGAGVAAGPLEDIDELMKQTADRGICGMCVAGAGKAEWGSRVVQTNIFA